MHQAGLPPSLVSVLAIDRVDLLGIAAPDRRDAIAVLSLIAAGLDPDKVARVRDRTRLSESFALDFAGWPKVIAALEAQGIITPPGRDGRRSVIEQVAAWCNRRQAIPNA